MGGGPPYRRDGEVQHLVARLSRCHTDQRTVARDPAYSNVLTNSTSRANCHPGTASFEWCLMRPDIVSVDVPYRMSARPDLVPVAEIHRPTILL